MLSTTVVIDKAAMTKYKRMYVLECTNLLAIPFAISSLVIEYIERVGLSTTESSSYYHYLCGVYELAGMRRRRLTYAGVVVPECSYNGSDSTSPASISSLLLSSAGVDMVVRLAVFLLAAIAALRTG